MKAQNILLLIMTVYSICMVSCKAKHDQKEELARMYVAYFELLITSIDTYRGNIDAGKELDQTYKTRLSPSYLASFYPVKKYEKRFMNADIFLVNTVRTHTDPYIIAIDDSMKIKRLAGFGQRDPFIHDEELKKPFNDSISYYHSLTSGSQELTVFLEDYLKLTIIGINPYLVEVDSITISKSEKELITGTCVSHIFFSRRENRFSRQLWRFNIDERGRIVFLKE